MVVVSDGAVNQGADPVAAARTLGVPVHAVLVGSSRLEDRAIAGIETSTGAGSAGRRRCAFESRRPSRPATGSPCGCATARASWAARRWCRRAPARRPWPSSRVTPLKAGLAVWTAETDSLRGELTGVNNARQVAVEVAPGRLGVVIVSGGLNWDLGFLRRALVGGLEAGARLVGAQR